MGRRRLASEALGAPRGGGKSSRKALKAIHHTRKWRRPRSASPHCLQGHSAKRFSWPTAWLDLGHSRTRTECPVSSLPHRSVAPLTTTAKGATASLARPTGTPANQSSETVKPTLGERPSRAARHDPKRALKTKRRLVEPTDKPVAEALQLLERVEPAASSRLDSAATWRWECERANFPPSDGGDGLRRRPEHFQIQLAPDLRWLVRMYSETGSSHRFG